MNAAPVMDALQWCFLAYFVALNDGYMMLNVTAFVAVRRHLEERVLEGLGGIYAGFEPPVSVLLPAYNEEATIAASVQSMLQLNYPESRGDRHQRRLEGRHDGGVAP